MLDVQVATLANQAMNHLLSGREPKRNGNAHPNIQPQDILRCRDGDVILVVGNDSQFAKLCTALGHGEWVADERFAANPKRVLNREALHAVLQQAFSTLSRSELMATLDRVGVPASPINTVSQVFADPQVIERQMLTEVEHPIGVRAPQRQSPMRFADAALRTPDAPPLLGQHSEQILRELRYDEDAIASLREGGVI